MRLNFKLKFAALTLAVMSCAGSTNAAVFITWDDYLREILLNNHALQAGVKSVEAEYYNVLAAVGAQRMQAGVNGSAVWVSKQGEQDNATAGSAVLSLTQRIDISGSFTLDEQQRILGYEISRANFDDNLNALVSTAQQTWCAAVLARENVRLQDEILRQRSENHRVTLEKYKQEVVPKLDVVRSEAQVVEAITLKKNAEYEYRNLLANLSFLAGGLDIEPNDEPVKVPAFDIQLVFEDALKFRPDMRAARLTLERAKLVKKLAAKGLAPTLDGSFMWTALAEPDGAASGAPEKYEAGLGLSLRVPISDGNQTRYSVLNADRLVQSSEANLASLAEQTRRDIAVAMNNWKNAESAEIDKKRQVARSEEELRITEVMYAEGMGAQIDLINAQTSYRTVRTEYLNAIKAMYDALVKLREAIGFYAPDEDGTWREAVARYGKGNNIIGEVGLKTLREQKRRQEFVDAAKANHGVVVNNKSVQDLKLESGERPDDGEWRERYREMVKAYKAKE